MEKRLTGKTRHRSNWLGKLILQVEVKWGWSNVCQYTGPRNKGKMWRDASTQDLAELQAYYTQEGGL
jgi:hypothetical protein